jgi:hypothetical protein
MKAKGNEQSIVNGARQKKKNVILPGIESGSLDPTNASWKKRMMRYMLYRSDVPVL